MEQRFPSGNNFFYCNLCNCEGNGSCMFSCRYNAEMHLILEHSRVKREWDGEGKVYMPFDVPETINIYDSLKKL